MSGDCNNLSAQHHAVELREGLDALRREGIFCGAIVRVQGEDFVAHTSVLAASCQYFRSMFTSGMKESSEHVAHLQGENLTAGGFRFVLEYIYTGAFPRLSSENVFEVLDVANHLQYEGAINHCSDFMIRQFHDNPGDVRNYVSSLQTAEMYGLTKLRDAVTKAMKENFLDISSKAEFSELVSKDVLLRILADDDLHVRSEENVLMAVLSWLNFDLENRLQHAEELLGKVRLILIEPYQLNELCSLHSAMAVPQFSDLVKQTLVQHALPTKVQVRARGNFKKVLLQLSDFGRYLISNLHIKFFNWSSGKWNDISGLKHPSRAIASGDACLVHANNLYISLDRTVYCFNPAMNQWTDLNCPMSSMCPSNIAMAMLGNCLYVSLGHDITRYNLSSGKWQYLYPLSRVMKKQGASLMRIDNLAAIDGYLFVLGATEKSGRAYWCFDPEQNEWPASLSGSISPDPALSGFVVGAATLYRGSKSNGEAFSLSVQVIDRNICVVTRDEREKRLCLWIGKVDEDMRVSWSRDTSNTDRWIPTHYQDSVVQLDGQVYIVTRTHWIDTGVRISPEEKYGVDLQHLVPENLRRLMDTEKSLFCEICLQAEHIRPELD